MNKVELDDDAMLLHAQAAKETAKREATPLVLPVLKMAICLLLVFAAACAEIFSATIGFRAAFPTLSDGTSLAATILPMRYAIAVYMLLGHVVLRSIAERFEVSIKWLFDIIGLCAIVLMLLAMASFMFAATYTTTGGADDQGGFAVLAGPALGVLCGSLFTVSFLAAHSLAGRFLKELPVAAAGWRAHKAIIEFQHAIDGVDVIQARIAVRSTIISELSQPNALAKRAAIEAAHEVGLVAAKAHELLSQRQLYGDVELRDDENIPLRDVPVAVLERRYANLAKLDFTHFYALLAKDASHV